MSRRCCHCRPFTGVGAALGFVLFLFAFPNIVLWTLGIVAALALLAFAARRASESAPREPEDAPRPPQSAYSDRR